MVMLAWGVGEKERILVAHTGWCIRLKCSNGSRFGNLVRTAVLHVNCSQKQNIALLSYTRCNSLHDFTIDRLFVISNKVLVEKFLNLVR